MGREIRRAACNRDGPDACGLLVEVEEDKLLSLRGDPAHPLTRGFPCSRTRRFPARREDPGRLLRPRIRGGRTVRALDALSGNLGHPGGGAAFLDTFLRLEESA